MRPVGRCKQGETRDDRFHDECISPKTAPMKTPREIRKKLCTLFLRLNLQILRSNYSLVNDVKRRETKACVVDIDPRLWNLRRSDSPTFWSIRCQAFLCKPRIVWHCPQRRTGAFARWCFGIIEICPFTDDARRFAANLSFECVDLIYSVNVLIGYRWW